MKQFTKEEYRVIVIQYNSALAYIALNKKAWFNPMRYIYYPNKEVVIIREMQLTVYEDIIDNYDGIQITH